jgi:hypothetical protein
MKRLLLSQGRTGSLNLVRYVKESNKKIKVYREPFNTTAIKDTNIFIPLTDILKDIDIFVENKIGNGSLPKELQNLSTDDLGAYLLSNFDIIGILCRKDLKAQTESVLNAKSSNIWDSQYLYKNIDVELFPEFKTQLIDEKRKLEYISTNFNIPIFYYEDLYLNNQKENLKYFCDYFKVKFDEEVMYNHMNISKKYRTNTEKKIL